MQTHAVGKLPVVLKGFVALCAFGLAWCMWNANVSFADDVNRTGQGQQTQGSGPSNLVRTPSRLIPATSPRNKEGILRVKYTTSIHVFYLEKRTRSLTGRIEKASSPRESEIAKIKTVNWAGNRNKGRA
jgi:hypothetical protein